MRTGSQIGDSTLKDGASIQGHTVFNGQAPDGSHYMNSEYRGAPGYQGLPETPPVQTHFPGLTSGGAEVNSMLEDVNSGNTP